MDDLKTIISVLGIVIAGVMFLYKNIKKNETSEDENNSLNQQNDWFDDYEESSDKGNVSVEAKKLEYESKYSSVTEPKNEGEDSFDFDGDLTSSGNKNNKSASDLIADFDLRKAVLYSEILNRKYK